MEMTKLAERIEAYDPKLSPDNRADELELHRDIVLGTGIGTMNPASIETTFVRSLDAAMTLVPEGWSTTLFIASKHHSTRCTLAGNGETVDAAEEVIVIATAPALALCAAALRARATKETHDETE